MNVQKNQAGQIEPNLDKRYQTLVVLWLGLLFSIGMYFLFSLFAAADTNGQPGNPLNSPLVVTFMVLGFLLVMISFLVKRKLLARSVEKQDVGLVQQSLLIACAMCEGAALLGLLERFIIGYRYYYFLFIFSAVGIALHFPRRTQLQAASFRNGAQLK